VGFEVGGQGGAIAVLDATDREYEDLRVGFTAAVSHELRTPLARLSILLESALGPGTDAAALSDRALAEVRHMSELIDDVLFLSELETGREVVSLGRTAVLPVLEEVVAEQRERAELAGVRIAAHGDASAEVPLRARMLRVVASNLTENAIRYAGEGASFSLAVDVTPDEVVLTARDDGTGVETEELPRLFERFFRADPARTSRGTGLGLAIVKHVVTAAGGRVEARGGPGAGLEIGCRFPRGAGAHDAHEDGAAQPGRTSPRTSW
jgi:signal transduction histidine kinase